MELETEFGDQPTIENYQDFSEVLDTPGDYSEDEMSAMKEFYVNNNEENDLREEVMTALDNSDSCGLRDTQLMALLSSPENYEFGGDRIEEDCDIDAQPYKPK